MAQIKTLRASGYVVNKVDGVYSFTELMEYITQHIQEWADSPLLWDFTNARIVSDAEPATLIRLIMKRGKSISAIRGGSKTALLTPNAFELGMFLMLSSMAECMEYGFLLKAFGDKKEALAWLCEERSSHSH